MNASLLAIKSSIRTKLWYSKISSCALCTQALGEARSRSIVPSV